MDMDWYGIHVEARPPADAVDLTVDEHAADALMDLLAEHDGIVSAGTGAWGATFSLQAPSAWEAVLQGSPLADKLAAKAGMPSWQVVRAEAVRQDVLDEQNASPTLPELASVSEAAEILGVSPQRVRELAATNASFPEPMYELRTGKLWLRAAIDAFAARARKPGRPPKAPPTPLLANRA
jgi:prophage regulatory protein